MPMGKKPSCSACKTHASAMWRRDMFGVIMCNSCYLNHLTMDNCKDETNSIASDSESIQSGSNSGLRTAIVAAKHNESSTNGSVSKDLLSASSLVRKSSRIKPSKSKAMHKANPWKGKNRRYIFKKSAPIKSHPSVSTITTRKSVFYQGFYYQIGDIVSLVDHSGDLFYAQIESLLQDQYCEKSAVISWLLPTTQSDSQHFDPSTYILGPTEELPRKMEYMEFICHAPADYYKPSKVEVPRLHQPENPTGFIWTSVGPRVCKLPTTAEIFGTDMPADRIAQLCEPGKLASISNC